MSGNRSRTAVVADDGKGNRAAALHEVRSDAPFLPVADFERLHQFRPDLVDVAIELTKEEAQFRRRETIRTNTLGFIHNLTAQIIPGITVLGYVGICAWLILHDHETAGASLLGGGIAMASLVAAFKKP